MPGAADYIVRWRRTDASQWEHSRARSMPALRPHRAIAGLRGSPDVGDCDRARCRGVRVDDWVFGVSSVAADGSESPVASAVPGGAFGPYVPPPPAQPQ